MELDARVVDGPNLQGLIDSLCIALERPVLLDDLSLVPISYSRQWGVDSVRTESILSRGPSAPVREALLAHDIAASVAPIRTAAVAELKMEGRVCMPVRRDNRLLAYIWLLDAGRDLTDLDLERLRAAAAEIGVMLASSTERKIADETDLVHDLRSADPALRAAAAERALATDRLADDELVLCLLDGSAPGSAPVEAARRAVRRLSVGHAVAATTPEGAAVIASIGDPVLRTLAIGELGEWLAAVAGAAFQIGQSGTAGLASLDEASRQAVLALRVARSGSPGTVASWDSLGADRVIAQLPVRTLGDVPERLRSLLREEPALTETLAVYLDSGGDVQATAAMLSLHRSGVYYRLRRAEELSGLDLSRGDDRLLAHLAIRGERLLGGRGAGDD